MTWWQIALRLVIALVLAFLFLRLLVALLIRWESAAQDTETPEDSIADRLRRTGGL